MGFVEPGRLDGMCHIKKAPADMFGLDAENPMAAIPFTG